jgi:hypothetical protein
MHVGSKLELKTALRCGREELVQPHKAASMAGSSAFIHQLTSKPTGQAGSTDIR